MKTIFKTIARLLKRERGMTLIEMVTVVAIMGVMAAVAVPMVSSQLGRARDKSFAQDKAMIQTAVDTFFTSAENVRFQGQRQYPILGANSGTAELNIVTGVSRANEVVNPWGASDPTTTEGFLGGIATPLNPQRGTQGGEPKWIDGPVALPDSNRVSEDNLNAEADSIAEVASGWYVTEVINQGEKFAVDTRDYFIDFRQLVAEGLLQSTPESASPDNGGGTVKGSYSWYVKATGEVDSVFFHFPTNGTTIIGTTAATDSDGNFISLTGTASANSVDLRGFQTGVYP